MIEEMSAEMGIALGAPADIRWQIRGDERIAGCRE